MGDIDGSRRLPQGFMAMKVGNPGEISYGVGTAYAVSSVDARSLPILGLSWPPAGAVLGALYIHVLFVRFRCCDRLEGYLKDKGAEDLWTTQATYRRRYSAIG